MVGEEAEQPEVNFSEFISPEKWKDFESHH